MKTIERIGPFASSGFVDALRSNLMPTCRPLPRSRAGEAISFDFDDGREMDSFWQYFLLRSGKVMRDVEIKDSSVAPHWVARVGDQADEKIKAADNLLRLLAELIAKKHLAAAGVCSGKCEDGGSSPLGQ
jgi:hypothetical protein